MGYPVDMAIFTLLFPDMKKWFTGFCMALL